MGKPTQNQNYKVQKQFITHFSHHHRLQLIPLTSPSLPCSACDLAGGGKATYSCRPCNFTLHVSCADMPRAITHPSHPGHRLTLLAVPAYIAGCFSCDACGLTGTGFSYHCSKCEFDVHALCANKPLSVRHRSHSQHYLKLTFVSPYGPKGFSCDVCRRVGKNQWLYRCGTCEFDAHVGCVTAAVQPHLDHVSSVPINNDGNAHNLQQHNSFPGPSEGNRRPIRPSGGNSRPMRPPGKIRPNARPGYSGGQNGNFGVYGQMGIIGPNGFAGQNFRPGTAEGNGEEGSYDETSGKVNNVDSEGDTFDGGDDECGNEDDGNYIDEGDFGGGSGDMGGGDDDVYGGDDANDLYPPNLNDTQSSDGNQDYHPNMSTSGQVTKPGKNRYGPTGRPRDLYRPNGSRNATHPKELGRRWQNRPSRINESNRPERFNNFGSNNQNVPYWVNGPSNAPMGDQVGQDVGQDSTDQGGFGDESDMYAGNEYDGYDEACEKGDDSDIYYGESYFESELDDYINDGAEECGDIYGDYGGEDGGEEDSYLSTTDNYTQPNASVPCGQMNQYGPGPRPRPNGYRNANQGAQPNGMSRRTRYGSNGQNMANAIGIGMMNVMVKEFAQNMMLENNDGGESVTSVGSSVLGGLFGADSESHC